MEAINDQDEFLRAEYYCPPCQRFDTFRQDGDKFIQVPKWPQSLVFWAIAIAIIAAALFFTRQPPG